MEKDQVKQDPAENAAAARPEDAAASLGGSAVGALGPDNLTPEAGQGDGAQPDAGSPEQRIAELEAEVASLKDQHLRALAEVENVRRRGQRDREEAAKFGASGLARDLLTVSDNLRRALESIPAEARSSNQHLDNLLAGVELVERELLQAFEKNGIQKVDPKPGDKFDANLHQAMLEMENTGQPGGTIAQVLQAGYVLNGRLLRAAMVGVAKGDPAPAQRVDTTA